jgi:hypothetical protein
VFAIGNVGNDVSISSDTRREGVLPVFKVSVLNYSSSVNESVVVRSLSGAGSVPADLTLHPKDSATFETPLSVVSFTRLSSCLSVLANASVGGTNADMASALIGSSLSVRSMASLESGASTKWETRAGDC